MVLTCECGAEFDARRATAKYCSTKCRTRARRRRDVAARAEAKAATETGTPDEAPQPVAFDVVAFTRSELQSAHKLETASGQQAMLVAHRLMGFGGIISGSETAALSKELSRLLTVLVGKGGQSADPIDEVRRKREEKITRARQA